MSIGVGKYIVLAAAGAGGEAYWINLLGGTSSDEFRAVAIDSEDNVICVGGTASDGVGIKDFLVAKFANDGTLEWSRTLGTNASSQLAEARGVAIDSSDNILVCGYATIVSQGDECIIAKYNSSGTIQWQKQLGSGSSSDLFHAVATDSSDNVIVVGAYRQASTSYQDEILIAKYNSSGTFQWDRKLDGNNDDYAFGVVTDSSDNIYLAGHTKSIYTGNQNDLFIAKYNSSGTIQWKRYLGDSTGVTNDLGKAIAIDSANNLYITGYSNTSDAAGNYDVVLAKYNSSGTFQWDKILGGAAQDFGWGVAVDADDNVYITGETTSDGAGNYDVLVAKYNSSGTLQWDKTLGTSGVDRGRGIALDSNGNIFVVGETSGDGAGSEDALVFKVRSDGTGNGTFGSWTYADAVLTAGEVTFTDGNATAVTDAAVSLTDATSSLTDAAAVLTQEKIDM